MELFLNGKSLGRKTMEAFGHLKWEHVTYEPGWLEAKGYVKGRMVAFKIVETTGAPVAIQLVPDRTRMVADGQDTAPIAVSILDAQGRVVPTANNRVTFEITGPGKNAGVGNGDPSSHELSQANFHSAFAGYCLVLAQAGQTTGSIRVTATAAGLASASVHLRVNKVSRG